VLASYVRFLAAHPGALAFGFLLTFFSAVGQTFFIALFNREIRGVYDLTSGEFGTLYAVATLTGAMLMMRAGRQIDHWPLPVFAGSVVLGLTIAAGLMATLPPGQVWVLFVAIVLLRLCGQGLMYHTAVTTAARTFHAHRGQAISTVSLGFAAGEAVLPVTIVAVVTAIGWRPTWGAAAAILLLLVLPLALWLAHRCLPAQAAVSGGGAPAPLNDRSQSQVLRDPVFWLLLPAMLAPAFVNTGVFFHQVPISEAKNWTLMVFASAFTTYAVSTLAMMLAGGRLVDRFSARAVLRVALVPIFLGLLLLSASDAPWIAHAYMALAGATAGLYYSASTAVWAELYGLTHLGAIRAMTHGLMMVSSALAPSLMGWMIDLGFAVSAIMLATSAYVALAIVLVQPALAMQRLSGPAG
jgi:MFS family permease